MNCKKIKLAAAISFSLAASQAIAAPNNFGDVRSIAMGGTGVASASATAASFFNPALVASKHDDSKDGFGLVLPSFNIKIADSEEVIDRISDYQDNGVLNDLTDAINRLNDNINDRDAAIRVINAADRFNDDLTALDEDAVRFEMGLGSAIVIPGQSLGVAVFVNSTAKGTVTMDYEDEDQTLYKNILAAANEALDGNSDVVVPLIDENNIESEGRVVAAAKIETGITFAHEFNIANRDYAIGISPKYQIFRAYDFKADIESFEEDNFDGADYESEKTAFNMDIGISTHFGDDDEWTVGFSGMNIIPVDFNTAEATGILAGQGRTIDINPLYRVGVAHTSEWHTIAVDLDLTKNEAFGFEDDTQFLSIGGEFDVYDTVQLRAGIRHNLASANGREGAHEDTQLTAGVGLSPFGVHIDLAGMIADGQYGAGAELGFTF